jgi:hypothetical protein
MTTMADRDTVDVDGQHFTAGDIVDITIQGARVHGSRDGNVLVYTTLAAGRPVQHELHLGQGWPGHIVKRVAPPQFPPQVGDLWLTWNRSPVIDRANWIVGSVRYPTVWVARRISHFTDGFTDDPDRSIRLFPIEADEEGSVTPHDMATGSAEMPRLLYRVGHVTTSPALRPVYDVPGSEPKPAGSIAEGNTGPLIVSNSEVVKVINVQHGTDGAVTLTFHDGQYITVPADEPVQVVTGTLQRSHEELR